VVTDQSQGAGAASGDTWYPNPHDLQLFTAEVCKRLGAPLDVASEVARHLVGANQAGHDSHGIIRLPWYVAMADKGELQPTMLPSVLRQSEAVVLLDGHFGFGHYSTKVASDLAAERAHQHGIGVVSVRHSGHIGRLGHYAEQLTKVGMVGIVVVGMAGIGVGAMVIPGTSIRFLGGNPWAVGLPTASGPPVLVDVSTSTVAEGKVLVALARGERLPEGCIVDSRGRATTDPHDYFNGGGLLPLGGSVAGHKGFGLGLAAALLGSLCAIGDDSLSLAGASAAAGSDPHGRAAGVMVMALNPNFFGDGDEYRRIVTRTVDALHRAGAGRAQVTVPGEPEAAARHQRAERLVLPAAIREELSTVASSMGIPLPPG
jgi:uncharacterized oxidoreductase